MLIVLYLGVGSMGDELYITIPGLIISAVLIYVLDYTLVLKNCDKHIRKVLSLVFAIATAPYTFLIPSSLIYG